MVHAPVNAMAAVAMVQESAQVNSNTCVSPSTRTYSFPSNVTSGNMIVATIGYKSSSQTVATPTDSQSSSWLELYHNVVTSGTSSDRSMTTFYTFASSTGAESITVTCPDAISGRAESVDMVLHEISGGKTLFPFFGFTTPYDSSDTVTDDLSFETDHLKVVDAFTVNARNASTPTSSQGGVWDQKSARGSIGSYHALSDGTQSALDFQLLDTSSGLATASQWSAMVYNVRPF